MSNGVRVSRSSIWRHPADACHAIGRSFVRRALLALTVTTICGSGIAATQTGPPLVDNGHVAGGWWALRADPRLDSSGQRFEGRIRALPPTRALGAYPKGRPIVADFASRQIDDTALFNFADGTNPLVFYGGGVPLNVGYDLFDAVSGYAFFADEIASEGHYFSAWWPLTVVDLGRYRMALQTHTIAGIPGRMVYVRSSALAKDLLQANILLANPEDQPAPATFQVIFRFYPDGTQVGTLHEGEVALFQQCNYQGKAVVFASDTPNFAELTSSIITLDNTAASVKLGNNTAAVLHSGSVYTGTRTVVKTDTPCLSRLGDTTSLLVRPLDRTLTIGPDGCPNCRLVGANLIRADLSGLDLSAADLTGANVSCASFAGTDNEDRVDLTTTKFDGVIFGTDPSCRTNFNWTILNADSIPPAQWRFVNLGNAEITGLEGKVLSSQASPLDLSNAVLTGASLQNAILDFATGLSGADLTAVKLPHASLRHVDLSNAVLSGAVLDQGNFEGSNLAGAVMSPCSSPAACPGASLRGAHLKNVNLAGSHLENAVFVDANFYSTNPAGNASCDVTSMLCASAQSATLTRTQFNNAYLYGTDFGGANVHGAIFDGAVLAGANFDGATVAASPDQVNSSFADAFLQGANLSGATIDGVTMVGAFLDFRPQGNTMFMQLNGRHTQFAGWATPGQPVCARVTYGAWASVPARNSTITCPDGTVMPSAGCGTPSPFRPLNPHWNNNQDISTTDPKASYQFDATYTQSAADVCERNIAW